MGIDRAESSQNSAQLTASRPGDTGAHGKKGAEFSIHNGRIKEKKHMAIIAPFEIAANPEGSYLPVSPQAQTHQFGIPNSTIFPVGCKRACFAISECSKSQVL